MPSDLARQWFVPGEGIDRHVIVTDIQRYLGNDATVRPGTGTGENEVRDTRALELLARHAYIYLGRSRLLDQSIPESHNCRLRETSCHRCFEPRLTVLSQAMIADLRSDSGRWRQEQRATGTRGSQSPAVLHVTGNTVPDQIIEPYLGSHTYQQSSASRSHRRDGDSPAVEVPYGASSARDRMPVDRMPVDRMPVDRMPVERVPVARMPVDSMDIDSPSVPPQDRRYASERGGYPVDPRDPRQFPPDSRGFPSDGRSGYPPQDPPAGYGRAPPTSASYGQDPIYARAGGYPQSSGDGAPPGYVRQGAYYVPVSSFEQPSIPSRTDPSPYGGNPYAGPPQPPRMDTRDARDPRNARDPRDQRDPRDARDPRDPRYSQDYQQDPRYAYPSPAATVSSMNVQRDRESVPSPSQQRFADTGMRPQIEALANNFSAYGSMPSSYDAYGGSARRKYR